MEVFDLLGSEDTSTEILLKYLLVINITEGTLTKRVSSTERVIHNSYRGSGIDGVHELVVERTVELVEVGKA